MSKVSSADGTTIDYERQGDGPPVILVGGGLTDRTENVPLAGELARQFSVVNYDRRGRGRSDDKLPYSLQREVEDIGALIDEAGGSAHLYGVSSGGALALEAAAGLAIDRLAVYEVPYCSAGEMPKRWREYERQLATALDENRPGDAVALFMGLVGTPEESIARMREAPFWAELERLGHTLAYEAACLGDGQPPVARLEAITAPTLVMTGGAGPQRSHLAGLPADFFDQPADVIAASIPDAERQTLPEQTHLVEPRAMARALQRFFLLGAREGKA